MPFAVAGQDPLTLFLQRWPRGLFIHWGQRSECDGVSENLGRWNGMLPVAAHLTAENIGRTWLQRCGKRLHLPSIFASEAKSTGRSYRETDHRRSKVGRITMPTDTGSCRIFSDQYLSQFVRCVPDQHSGTFSPRL